MVMGGFLLRYDTWVFFTQIFLSVLQVVLVCILLYFIFNFVARSMSAFTDVPFVPTDYGFLPRIAEALEIRPNDVVYDLGCGDGRLLFYCAKRNPQAKFIGLERNLLLIAYITIKKFMLQANNIEIRREDFFAADFSDATRIFVFLLPEVMTSLAPKLNAPRIVSRAFQIQEKKAVKEFILKEAPPGPWNTYTVYVYS
jgi:SAM-dependent methyltransferase